MKTFIHNFLGYGRIPSRSKVYIKEINDEFWIGFENIGEGTSVTNATEQLATEIIKKENLNPDNCRFFEWYSEYGEDVDEISYTWKEGKANNPKWEHKDNFIKDIWNE